MSEGEGERANENNNNTPLYELAGAAAAGWLIILRVFSSSHYFAHCNFSPSHIHILTHVFVINSARSFIISLRRTVVRIVYIYEKFFDS